MDSQAPLNGHPRPGYFHVVSLGLLISLPVTLFMISLSFMTFLFQKALVWLVVSCCLALSSMFMVVRQAREGPKYWFNLGVVCFMAVVVGTAAGLWNHWSNMDKYWAYQGQRTYNNVGPAEPALQRLDAGKLVFTTDSVIDNQITSTLVDGRTYCVAPIVSKAAAGPRNLQYWAAGVDCCQKGANFTCDHANDPMVHSGLVYLNDLTLPDFDLGKFRDAAKTIMDAQNLKGAPPQDALFVRWVKDVDAAHQEYWYTAANFVVIGLCVYTVFAIFAAFMIHFASRRAPMKSKMEARSFGGTR